MDSVQAVVHAPAESAPVDVDDLIGRCLGRLDLAERVLQKFQSTLEKDVQQLEDALRSTDAGEIAHLAHRIKGASLAVSAHDLKECAASIETSATEQRLEDIPVHLARLKQARSRLEDFRFKVTADNPSC